MIPMIVQGLNQFAATGCGTSPSFFGFPTWYKYLPTTSPGGVCKIELDFSSNAVTAWLIGLGIADIALHLAALVAIGFVVYGGVQYINSQGQPDATAQARKTIINALVGLVVAIGAATFVSFVASRFN